MDDSRTVQLRTASRQGFLDPYGRLQTPVLAVQCKENTTAAFISWDIFLSTYPIDVTYRIDKLPAETRRWNVSSNFEGVGLWTGAESIPFIRWLFGHDRLFVRVTPHGENSVEAVFDITGLQEVAQPLMEACGWTAKTRPAAPPRSAEEEAREEFKQLLRAIEEMNRQAP
ncbi:MAG: type VI secretion system-associated protein TagO [Geminicoccaceae bacterium]